MAAKSPASAAKSKGSSKPKSKRPPKAKTEVKTRRTVGGPDKKKKKVYTPEELGIPKLNGIIPAGVQKAKGKKKGKVFVDDAASMMAIMGMVQAEKEGEREGKIMKARQLEEIREAKKAEIERRAESKKARLVSDFDGEVLYIFHFANMCRKMSKTKSDKERSAGQSPSPGRIKTKTKNLLQPRNFARGCHLAKLLSYSTTRLPPQVLPSMSII